MHAFLVMSVGETASAESGAQNPQLLQVHRSSVKAWEMGMWIQTTKHWYDINTYIYIYILYICASRHISDNMVSCNGGTCGHHPFLGFPWNKASILGYPHLWKPPYDIHIFWPVDLLSLSLCQSWRFVRQITTVCLEKEHRFFHFFYLFLVLFFPRASERRVLPIVGVCISSSHLQSSHLHTFSSSYLLPFTSSHLHTFSSSRLLTSHLLIFTSSHLLIFTSSHFTSSHFTSSHLHISSSHCHTFSSSHLLIFTSSHLQIFSSSHLLIFTSAHLHIFSSSHLHIFTSSHLHIFSSCPLALFALSFFSISLLKAGAGAVPTRRHETQPFRTKRGSIVKNWRKIAISTCPAVPRNPFARNEVRSSKTEVKLRFPGSRCKPFARNEGRSPKTEVKVRVQVVPRNIFARNEVLSSKAEVKLRFPGSRCNPFARNEGRSPKTEVKVRVQVVPRNPFAQNEARSSKTEGKLRFQLVPRNPSARNEVRLSKTEVKLWFFLCVQSFCVLCVKASMCKSICV